MTNDILKRLAALPPEKRKLFTQQFIKGQQPTNRKAIVRQPRQTKTFPLSFVQERMWFTHQWAPVGLLNEAVALQITGPLAVDVLEHCFEHLTHRHESLRTTFSNTNGQVVQRIAPAPTISLTVIDLQQFPASEQAAEVQRIASAEAQYPFALDHAPLFRLALLTLGATAHVLVMTFHHIIFDGWSAGVMAGELATIYDSLIHQQPVQLPTLPIQYVDFAIWQREEAQQQQYGQQLQYWQHQFADMPAMLHLPTDWPRPSIQAGKGAQIPFVIPHDLTAKLMAVSQQEGVTLFMLLLAVFKVLLYRYTHQSDMVVGTPITNRTRNELEPLIGVFINTLALRSRITDTMTFQTLLQQMRRMTVDAYEHQDVPFEKLIDALNVDRHLGHTPLFQVMFDLQKTATLNTSPSGLTIKPLKIHTGTAKFDLSLQMTETEAELTGAWEYDTALFTSDTIQRMSAHFHILLAGVVADPQLAIARLPLLSETERRQLLVEWSGSPTDFPRYQCIHHLFEAQVEQSPQATAITFATSITPEHCTIQQLTYDELNTRANQLAHQLQSMGVKPGSIVGICIERSPDMVIGILATLKAGGAYLPLDPTYPPERLLFIAYDANIQLLLTQTHLMETVPDGAVPVLCVDTIAPTAAHQANPMSSVTAQDLAYVIYTSGSTGKAKGVMLGHQGLCNMVAANIHWFKVQPASRLLQFASFSFDGSVYEVFVTLVAGATLCMASQAIMQPGPDLLHLMQEQAITHAILPPAVLMALPESSLPSLQALIASGDACSDPILQRWAHGRRFINGYGPTENTVCTTLHDCTDDDQTPPIGRPIDNVELYVLDAMLQPVPIGVAGELYIGGPGLALGYLGRPDVTAERFLPHPFSPDPDARLYRSGDMVRYQPDGNLAFVGRVDQQVKVRGFRIELGEIEHVLRQHPAIKETVVLAPPVAHGDKRLVAYVRFQPDQAAAIQELRHFLHEQLPEYMVPRAFVQLDTIPLTPNGKIDYRAFPDPDLAERDVQEAYEPPRNAVEELLVEIWEQSLAIKQPGIHDNFFHLGGHSLLITQLLSHVSEVFGMEVAVRTFLEVPTIARVAEELISYESQLGQMITIARLHQKVRSMSTDEMRQWLGQPAQEESHES